MTQEQFDRERRYCAAMAIIREMLEEGILSPKGYRHIETILAAKYLPVLGRLFA